MDTLYTSDGRKYEGMSVEAVQAMHDQQRLTCTFVEKDVFDTFIAEKEAEREANKAPFVPTKERTDWQAEKAKGSSMAINFLAAKLGLE